MLGGFRRFPAVGLKEHAHDILFQQLAASIKWDDRLWRLRELQIVTSGNCFLSMKIAAISRRKPHCANAAVIYPT